MCSCGTLPYWEEKISLGYPKILTLRRPKWENCTFFDKQCLSTRNFWPEIELGKFFLGSFLTIQTSGNILIHMVILNEIRNRRGFSIEIKKQVLGSKPTYGFQSYSYSIFKNILATSSNYIILSISSARRTFWTKIWLFSIII